VCNQLRAQHPAGTAAELLIAMVHRIDIAMVSAVLFPPAFDAQAEFCSGSGETWWPVSARRSFAAFSGCFHRWHQRQHLGGWRSREVTFHHELHC
jgi:hypothetical protein